MSEDAWPVTGVALRERRVKLGLTQREIAEACGVTPAAVGAWETGATKPRHSHLGPLSKILQLDGLQQSRDRLELEVADLREKVNQLTDVVADLGQQLEHLAAAERDRYAGKATQSGPATRRSKP